MKKILILLFTLFVGLLTFCNAEDYIYTGDLIDIRANQTLSFNEGFCSIKMSTAWNTRFKFYKNDGTLLLDGSIPNMGAMVCFNTSGYVLNDYGSISTFNGFYIDPVFDFYGVGECPFCPEVDTGAILSGSCDTNYCVENDLCPVPSNFSQLFINDLEFPGTPIINVNIPDYIQWDYSSNETGFDLYVGSGYDQDYIDSVLKINSYRPDSSDFTNIFVSGLTLLFPYLIFALFLVFMWKLIKRIFKH